MQMRHNLEHGELQAKASTRRHREHLPFAKIVPCEDHCISQE
jgi:hypothetical protein